MLASYLLYIQLNDNFPGTLKSGLQGQKGDLGPKFTVYVNYHLNNYNIGPFITVETT